MGTPLSGYARRFVGATGEPGIQGETGSTGADGAEVTTGVYSAYAGGGQANATILSATDCLVTTVASANDSVKAKTAVVDARQIIRNATANDLAIYPRTGENFYGYAANAPYILGGGQAIEFVCFNVGVFRF